MSRRITELPNDDADGATGHAMRKPATNARTVAVHHTDRSKEVRQMRRFLKSGAGSVALIVVALIVTVGGSATAARLITGADIKNGTITGKDIKAGTISEKRLSDGVKAKLNAGGPQGPKGDPGTPAPGGFVVRDGDDSVVNGWVSVDGDTLLRVVDGALWRYRWDGVLANDSVNFDNVNCTGNALIGVGSDGTPNPQRGVHAGNGQSFRIVNATPQVRAIKSTRAVDGECDATVGIQLTQELTAVGAPASLKGPLTVAAIP